MMNVVLLAVIGLLSGIISGMGVGGGTILIPALVMMTDISQQGIQGINLIYFTNGSDSAYNTCKKRKC